VQLGTGGHELPGFLNTDLFGEVSVDITRPLPFPDASIDLLYANHLIEHIYARQARAFLREAHRALAPGGLVVLATPSIEKISRILYGSGARRDELLAAHAGKIADRMTPAAMINGMAHINYGHRYLYDLETMALFTSEAGFASTVRLEDNRVTPDPVINAHLASRDPAWDLETETFVLTKSGALTSSTGQVQAF
jgi:predicted SAM-dependent methyltransferase